MDAYDKAVNPARTPAQLILLMCAAEVLSMAGAVTFPALLPTFIDVWSLSTTDAGWINGIYFAGYLVAVPVLVSLTDRLPPRRIYLFCLMLSALANLGFATITDSFWAAMLFRALGGIGLAGSYMPGLKLLTDHLEHIRPGHDNSRAVAFYTASFGIGTSLSFFMAGEIAAQWDWQTAFAVTVAGPLLGALLSVALLPRTDPRPHQAPSTHLLDFRPVLRCRAAMGYVFAYAVHNFELFAYRSWMVAFLVFAAATHPGQGMLLSATAWAAIANLFGLPSSVLGNELSRRIGRHRAITIIQWTSAALACSVGFAAGAPFWVVVALVMIYGWTITGESSSVTAGVVAAAPEGYRGATMAVHSSIGFLGSFAGPLLFGVALDLTSISGAGGDSISSWGWAFACSGAVVALGPVALAVFRDRQETGHRSTHRERAGSGPASANEAPPRER